MQQLMQKLAETAFNKLISMGDIEPVVTRARHRQALETRFGSSISFKEARDGGVDAVAAGDAISERQPARWIR